MILCQKYYFVITTCLLSSLCERIKIVKIYIGADHRGFKLKRKLIDWLRSKNYQVIDGGNRVYDPQDDYPDFVQKVVEKISQQKTFLAEGNLTVPHSREDKSGLSKSSIYERSYFVKSENKDVDSRGIAPLRTDLTDRTPHLSEPTPKTIVTENESSLGIVICGSGVGVCIAANRTKGIRCVLGFNSDQVKHARRHDHTNVLALGADYVDLARAQEMVTTFLNEPPDNQGKYLRRIKKLDEADR